MHEIMEQPAKATPKKYVVVLAHADGWGALSANKIVKHLHERHPDVGVYLVVSQATKNKEGKILTKLDDLKSSRELKETNLLQYFEQVDALYEKMPSGAEVKRMLTTGTVPEGIREEDKAEYFKLLGQQEVYRHNAKLLTFKQLAKQCCADGEVHYTTKGGPKGGEEVGGIVAALEKQNGHGPEVLLSVDTMAVLPRELLEKYNCFSTHPGPLDTIKIEGMQGTLRSLANQVLYDSDGEPLPADHIFGMGMAYVKGTLFMQHPELDKGPPVACAQVPVCPGMCAYSVRDGVYDVLIDEMIDRLPVLLDTGKRVKLVAKATHDKEELDKKPHRRIAELEPELFATWQGMSVGFADGSGPHGVHVAQNEIVSPDYFYNQMRQFFPGPDADFEKAYTEIYGSTLERLAKQKSDRLTDPWARYYAGEEVTIKQYDPKTGKVIAEYKNPGRS